MHEGTPGRARLGELQPQVGQGSDGDAQTAAAGRPGDWNATPAARRPGVAAHGCTDGAMEWRARVGRICCFGGPGTDVKTAPAHPRRSASHGDSGRHRAQLAAGRDQ
jgi:hypothetical protein